MSPEAATEAWVTDFVVALGLCPFAARPLRAGQVAFLACGEPNPEDAFYWAGAQVQGLLATPATRVDTALLIFPAGLDDFTDFLGFVEAIEDFLADSGADAAVQLAHFHPRYTFADAPPDDPANATNRAPYPTVQLLRVDSVARAVEHYPDPKGIPVRSAALLREPPPG
ncbi:DUF1415 family protein [Lewinella sp. IMCC34183]|uniref:DUF1415 family protein n=1 Tax=Lewinella sp. IMCC34183 TaxID=2248762 RepID=UPI0013004B31|nr:DUF1415 domain-containing protein [Lewinella sp. IMCC34183]